MQTKMPRFQLAHLGCLFFLQSAQLLLPSNFTKLFSVCWFCAALSAPGFGRRDICSAVAKWCDCSLSLRLWGFQCRRCVLDCCLASSWGYYHGVSTITMAISRVHDRIPWHYDRGWTALNLAHIYTFKTMSRRWVTIPW